MTLIELSFNAGSLNQDVLQIIFRSKLVILHFYCFVLAKSLRFIRIKQSIWILSIKCIIINLMVIILSLDGATLSGLFLTYVDLNLSFFLQV